LRLVPSDLSLAVLDALEVDSIAAFVGPERPLQGLAGLLDWRLCGAVSRAILEGTFTPERGEVLLLPSGGRLPTPRIFCFGLAGDASSAELVARRACDVLARAGARSVALALPPGTAGASLARALIEAGVKGGFSCHVLLGDGRAIARELEAAVRELRVDAEVALPASRGDGRGAASLPAKGPVVR
jgi:hypothetical protein